MLSRIPPVNRHQTHFRSQNDYKSGLAVEAPLRTPMEELTALHQTSWTKGIVGEVKEEKAEGKEKEGRKGKGEYGRKTAGRRWGRKDDGCAWPQLLDSPVVERTKFLSTVFKHAVREAATIRPRTLQVDL